MLTRCFVVPEQALDLDLKTMTAEPGPSAAIDSLIPLRDGRTFLTSASGVSLLNIPVEGDTVFELVPVTR